MSRDGGPRKTASGLEPAIDRCYRAGIMVKRGLIISWGIVKRLLLVILLAGTVVLSPAVVCAQDAGAAPDSSYPERRHHKKEKQEPCGPKDHACRVNRKVKKIENAVEGVASTYDQNQSWAPHIEIPKQPPYGTAAFRKLLWSPTYVLRALTWPFAIVGRKLIEKGVVNKVIDVVSNKDRTLWVYPVLEMGFGQGFGGGVGLTHTDFMDKDYQINASYRVHVNLNQRGQFGVFKPDVAYVFGKPLSFRLITDINHENQNDFYGVGIGTSEGNKGKFSLDRGKLGGAIGLSPIEKLLVEVFLVWEGDSSGPPKDSGPDVQTLFPANQLEGFGKVIQYAVFGLRGTYDNRDAIGRPDKGGRYRFSFRRYQTIDTSPYSYNEFRLDASQYIKLMLPRHVLALHTSWIFLHETGDSHVPFWRLARMDVYSPNRGFGWGRFRDRDRAVINIEYRFPVWDFLDGLFFFDTGRVFHNPTDFSFKHFKYSGGAGLRLATKDYFLLRFEVGYGGEGVNFLFKTSQAF